ncbi:MAG: DUF2283 domain-containing protein [bacterium]|jgi:hypothetical protein|nr:DUF2283 domain-containing protein [bacterium]
MSMKDMYLEVTYRHGKVLAAYLYLPRRTQDRCDHSVEREAGIVVDFHKDGRPIGLELTDPARVSAEIINRILKDFHLDVVTREDLAPLLAA